MKVYGVTGWKNSGKTGLMERLVVHLVAEGLTVSTVKHAHHSFDVDHPGKDSFRHRAAGANQVMLSSANRWALMSELRGAEEPGLDDLLSRLDPVELVLVEGFKSGAHPKIEAHRVETGHPLIAHDDPLVRAVASDGQPECRQPLFDLNDTVAIGDFIRAELSL
ncbi:molybdopterin-guanine dinucleotide biosynthesis protein B [Alphaproteobacteria bacterium KMM 3653]|uniref:Molybdopterin-guanine dinucleotide biosynthesis protein B n=1 Tax=Harenicola maris TaxID=2841044 RepID=A0AAP2G901_9RHOB|nr:molybdopterin-guanine dinucleotide biosynthesis protein B [Harenicola maris]